MSGNPPQCSPTKAHVLQPADVVAAKNFLSGFMTGCAACGLVVPHDFQERATIERGWLWSALRPIEEMREQGLTEEQIVDELLAIEISAWEMCGA